MSLSLNPQSARGTAPSPPGCDFRPQPRVWCGCRCVWKAGAGDSPCEQLTPAASSAPLSLGRGPASRDLPPRRSRALSVGQTLRLDTDKRSEGPELLGVWFRTVDLDLFYPTLKGQPECSKGFGEMPGCFPLLPAQGPRVTRGELAPLPQRRGALPCDINQPAPTSCLLSPPV